MKELSLIEMNEVSGAGLKQLMDGSQNFFMSIVDGAVGGILGFSSAATAGALQGALSSQGATGGILGVGNVSLIVSSIWGFIQGGLSGAILGAYNGAAWGEQMALSVVDSVLNGTGGGFKPNAPSYL